MRKPILFITPGLLACAMKMILLACAMKMILTSCRNDSTGPHSDGPQKTLLAREDWAPDVRQGLNDFISRYANTDGAYVVFDFDNTSSIFDIEEQLAIYQMETMSFAMTPTEFAKAIGTGLDTIAVAQDWITDIATAYDSLYIKWGPFDASGIPDSKQTSLHADKWWQEFATKMFAMYENIGEWMGPDNSYCWILYWFTGMTPQQVYDIALCSHSKYSAVATDRVTMTSPAGIESRLGQKSCEWTCGVQVTENMRELWRVLKLNGIDVWVCSASGLEQVKAAVDAFGLHDYVSGVTAMTLATDATASTLAADAVDAILATASTVSSLAPNATASSDAGCRYKTEYDYGGCAALPSGAGWKRGALPTGSVTGGPGKVTAILNAIAPLYGGRGPLAGFMDSTGDFYFCTEFASLKTVVCFNRADRKSTDGGGIIAEVAVYERDALRYDFAAAQNAGDTYYLLQGRDENGLRTFRPSNSTLKYGAADEKLFRDEANEEALDEMISSRWTVKEAIETNASRAGLDIKGYHAR